MEETTNKKVEAPKVYPSHLFYSQLEQEIKRRAPPHNLIDYSPKFLPLLHPPSSSSPRLWIDDAFLEPSSPSSYFPVHSFRLFHPDFCAEFLKEIYLIHSTFGQTTPSDARFVLDYDGLDLFQIKYFRQFFEELTDDMDSYLHKMLPSHVLGSPCFSKLEPYAMYAIKYSANGGQTFHPIHVDDSALSLNVCLGEEFDEGDLYFILDSRHISKQQDKGKKIKVQHEKGKGVLHWGDIPHGANKITSGERVNLVFWWKRSDYFPLFSDLPLELQDMALSFYVGQVRVDTLLTCFDSGVNDKSDNKKVVTGWNYYRSSILCLKLVCKHWKNCVEEMEQRTKQQATSTTEELQPDTGEDEARKRRLERVKVEVLQTERTYVESLEESIHFFLDPLSDNAVLESLDMIPGKKGKKNKNKAGDDEESECEMDEDLKKVLKLGEILKFIATAHRLILDDIEDSYSVFSWDGMVEDWDIAATFPGITWELREDIQAVLHSLPGGLKFLEWAFSKVPQVPVLVPESLPKKVGHRVIFNHACSSSPSLLPLIS
eukprot:CAMPEP_0174258310 /NCGR_PEP_ID=MMETSP0439-20130205/7318_1 /TAXON_ID=0 /ORGANISM="Stereomyxa ramosa, Strain Chinc5" /LENGTH=543 /DNA_ID=CAMNT_0015341765 /DNA_START=36 /DNA_END=1666 /DNA_ORIENTATION=-